MDLDSLKLEAAFPSVICGVSTKVTCCQICYQDTRGTCGHSDYSSGRYILKHCMDCDKYGDHWSWSCPQLKILEAKSESELTTNESWKLEQAAFQRAFERLMEKGQGATKPEEGAAKPEEGAAKPQRKKLRQPKFKGKKLRQTEGEAFKGKKPSHRRIKRKRSEVARGKGEGSRARKKVWK